MGTTVECAEFKGEVGDVMAVSELRDRTSVGLGKLPKAPQIGAAIEEILNESVNPRAPYIAGQIGWPPYLGSPADSSLLGCIARIVPITTGASIGGLRRIPPQLT